MKKINQCSLTKTAVAALCLTVAYAAPTVAQEDEGGFAALEEIFVTGRKREESLQDVPISISVIGSTDLAELNVLRQEDLAELVPGYHYQQGIGLNSDRTAAVASIRGIGASDLNTNRTKVATFIDGFPILGSIGAVNVGGSTQVEVYRGPQSAAFGRSTFAGAINYVTADPGDTYEGSVGINWGDQGTRILSGSFGGPITDTLGFQLGANIEDSEAPSDLYTHTDGVVAKDEKGKNLSARFVFTPNDAFKAKLTFSRDEINDGNRADFYASSESTHACFNSLDNIGITFFRAGMVSAGPSAFGTYECELEVHPDTVLEQLNDYGRFFDNNPDVLDDIINNGYDNGDPAADYVAQPSLVAQGAADNYFGQGLTIEEQVRIIYDGFSVAHDDAGASSERDRVMGQFEYLFDNNSLLQLSVMKSEEEVFRGYSRVAEQEVQPLYFDAVNGYYAGYSNPDFYGMGMSNGRRTPDNDTTNIDETYLELRWASPDEERLRYVVGASYYDYEYVYNNFGAPGWLNLVNGTADLFEMMIDPSELGNSGGIIQPTSIASEITTNTAVFANASYDFTDTITGSFEARYANDDVGAILDGIQDSVEASTFSPRIALNWTPSEDTTYYLQYSTGVNPAGINANLLDPDLRATLNNGVPIDDTIYGGTINENITSVNYTADRYVSFDEEKLTNYEFGFKGAALDGRLSYTGALYFMRWDDRLENIALNWDYTYADDNLEGTLVTDTLPTGPAGVYYVAESDFTSVNQIFTNTGQTETKGIELQANYRINDNWSISGNAAYMRTEYTEYCSEDDYIGQNVGGLPELAEVAGLSAGTSEAGNPCWVFDGLDVAEQPDLSYTVIPRYATDFGDGFRFNASATFRHQGESYNDYANTRKRAAQNRVNLNFGLSKDAWSANVYVENLLDDTNILPGRYTSLARFTDLNNPATIPAEYQYIGPDGVTYGTLSFAQNEGRRIGLRLNYNF